MKYILLFLVSISFTACSMKGLENNIENLFIASSGNKPPSFFKIANTQTMRDYVFDVKDATFSLPSAKEKDFTTMGGWEGSTHYNKDVVLYLDKGFGVSYHIHITSSIFPYTERERAIENGDVAFLRSAIKIDNTDKLFIKKFGKERYTCTEMEYTNVQYPNEKYVGYECYKHNNNKTQSKSIHIRLTYTRTPNISKELEPLANEYSYEDLQQRAQRVLDSLYIKDGWEK